jgi:Raf kinase inhibitor-like YbhB/YbcL family protein
MRRRRACLAVAATVALFSACDRDDGRQLQPPDSYAVYQLQNTTPSTTSTVAPPPSELIPVQTSSTPTSTSTSTSTPNPASGEAAATGLQLTGPWEDGAAIPVEYTCDAAGDVPLISWTAPPDGTAELALSVVDPDAGGFVHWVVIRLPPQAGSVGGGQPLVAGAAEASNSFGDVGWGGPCPPPGAGPHTYVFTLHVLDQATELPADSPTGDLLTAVDAATASTATYTGTYERA